MVIPESHMINTTRVEAGKLRLSKASGARGWASEMQLMERNRMEPG